MKEETLRPWHTYPCCAVPWHKDTPNWKLSYLLTYVNSSDILVVREKEKSSSIYFTTDWDIVVLRMLFPWLKTEHVILSLFYFFLFLFNIVIKCVSLVSVNIYIYCYRLYLFYFGRDNHCHWEKLILMLLLLFCLVCVISRSKL